MPESLKGPRWQHKLCSCRTSQITTTQGYTQAMQHAGWGVGQVGRDNYSGGLAGTPHAVPDPACPQCHGTGHLEEVVLRKGAWRHTRSTEMVFMLSKNMSYWSDGEAVREEAMMKPQRRTNGHSLCTYDPPGRQAPPRGDRGAKADPGVDGPGGRNPRNVLCEPPSAAADLQSLRAYLQAYAPEVLAAYEEDQGNPPNVLRPASSQLNMEHYASFPSGLIEPLILASVPAQCCAV